jgi:hypothetical protein
MSEKKGLVFDDANPGVEFEHEDGWKLSLRVCTMEELDNIRKETSKKKEAFKKVGNSYQRFAWDEVDDKKQSQMIWDYCITAWEGIYGKDGKDIPCTAENKYMMMQKSQPFAKFVTESMQKLNSDEEEQKTESEKN